MHMKKIFYFLLFIVSFFQITSVACAEGLADAIRSGAYKQHRYLIAGDHVTSDRAQALASLFYAPLRAADPTLGEAEQKNQVASQVLDDLKAMNEVGGKWEFFLMKAGTPLLISVLQSLGSNGLSNVEGVIYCYGFKANDEQLAKMVYQTSQGRIKLFFVG
jgi:hypothetical protein